MARGEWVIYAAYGLVALATFLVARMLLLEQESRLAQENLEDTRDRKSKSVFINLLRPIVQQYVVPRVRGRKVFDEKRRSYKRLLTSAGLRDELTPDEFIALKVLSIALFPAIGVFLKKGDFLDLDWWQICSSSVAGWFWPDFWAKNARGKRQKKILKSMPFIVDLLALSTEAGLDFSGAMTKVVEKSAPSPLVEEFAFLLKEIKVGSSRQDALREMALRIDMPEVNSFVAILISADQMGAPVGKILRQQSEQIRGERMVRAEKAGAAAAQKVLIPLMLFIVPAVVLMVLGPFFLAWIGGSGGGGDL